MFSLPLAPTLRLRLRITSIVCALVFFAAFVVFDSIDYTGKYAKVDLAQYRLMAQAAPSLAQGTIPVPFCYRIAAPWLAGMLAMTGVSEPISFRVLTLSTIIIFLSVMSYRIVKRTSFSYALLGACWLLFSPFAMGFTIFNYFQLCDVLSVLLLMIALYSLEKSHFFGFALSSSLAILTRETALILVPVSLVWMMKQERQQKMKLLISLLPLSICFIVVRTTIIAAPSEWSPMNALTDYLPKLWSLEHWFRILICAWSPLSLVIGLMISDRLYRNRIQRYEWLFLGLCFCSVFVAKDTERMLLPALLLLMPLCIQYLHSYSLPPGTLAIIFIATMMNASHPLFTQWTPLSTSYYYALILILNLIILLLLLVYKARMNMPNQHIMVSS